MEISLIMRKYIIMMIVVASIFQASGLLALAQRDTTDKKDKKEQSPIQNPYHRNVIKFNPTPMLLWGNIRNITFSYERLIAKNQSLSLQVGYLLFPRLAADTIANLIALRNRSKNGINIALDYRYYPMSRNRRPAPDGLYLGTYFSYYGFTFKNNFDILHTTIDQNGALEGKMNILNLGLSIGYQFVFWKRVSLDMLMFGPSLSYYFGRLDISGNLDESQIQNIDQEVVDKLFARFPMLKTLFTTENLTFIGAHASLSVGFRYSIQLGFHF
jgi:hypothetical protein